MFKRVLASTILLLVTLPGVHGQTKQAPSTQSQAKAQKASVRTQLDRKVEELLSKMTLEEKVGQMTQITLDVIGKGKSRFASDEPFQLDPAKVKAAIVDYHVGSVLNTANNRARTREIWFQIVGQIQDVALKQTRLKIPVIYGIDSIHGATYTADSTIFPYAIAQGASRNRELVRRAAEITAYETRASSIPWSFSPVLDLGADPRFPRQFETFGEDPYLITELGLQTVKGYEGDPNDISKPNRVASSLKHFLGYMTTASGKDRTPSFISEDALREYYLPPFKAAVEAGAHSVMINSGLINGIPVHADYNILTKLLKEELDFQGLVVTDWADIENLRNRDRVAATDKDAIRMAINAGIDMSMVPYNYETFFNGLVALVKEGQVKQSRIDDAVRRILRVKLKLGLFERPVTNPKDYPEFGSKAFEQASYDMAAESITLLRNEGNILPLKRGTKLLVTGPNANSMRTLNGPWTYSWQGEKVEEFAGRYNTILEALQKEAGAENIRYVPGVSYKHDGKYWEEYADRFDDAIAAAKDVDAIILCLGENTFVEKPGDLNDLYMSDLQTQLAQKLTATGKPVILVLNEGRPRLISRFEQPIKAIVQTYLPGNFGGDALADILFGDVNPSGKLPYTYPRYPNALTSYIHKPADEQKRGQGVYDYEADYNPQFDFGHGLSYTTFKYSNLKLSRQSGSLKEPLTITVEVTNAGGREGKEAVELYTTDLVASVISPDMKRLRGFEKVNLKPGETKTVSFKLTKDDLSYFGPDGRSIIEPGEFDIRVGDQVQRFTLTDTQ